MKQQVDPKVAIIVVVIVLVAVGGFFAIRGRSAGRPTAAEQSRHTETGNQMMRFTQEKKNAGSGGPQGFDPKTFKPSGSGP